MPKAEKREGNARLKVSRRFVPGTRADASPGKTLDIVALGFDAGELFGVDLASRAFVRVETGVLAHHRDLDDGRDEDAQVSRQRVGDVYRIVVKEPEPVDVGRPEAIWSNVQPSRVGRVTRRSLRRLCSQVKFGEHPGTLVLGSRARSRSYADLHASDPSMMLISLRAKNCRLFAQSPERTMLTFVWGGLEQSLVVHEPRICAIERAHRGHVLQNQELRRALGFKIGFALIGYARVKDRYVEKVVISLIGSSFS